MNTYSRWDMHMLQFSQADDGFGNLVRITPDWFWHNADALRVELYSGGLH